MAADRIDSPSGWTIQASITAIAIFAYVFMEWLFFVTKPSFMTGFSLLGRLQVLFVTPLPLFAAGGIVLLVLWTPAFAGRSMIARRVSSAAGSVPAAVVLAALFFLLVDNFTFTVLHFGIRMAEGPVRYIYVCVLLALVVFSYRIVDQLRVKCSRPTAYRAVGLAAAVLVVVSVAATAVARLASRSDAGSLDIEIEALKNRPNIILISVDGLNAERMSVYGYGRATTPFLHEMADSTLICDNCFSNADASLGSIASIFTGKLPTQTRVYYPPEMLQGKDAYEHLPGILRRYGYRSIDISDRHYMDPIEMNMRDSFDLVNSRRTGRQYPARLFEPVFGEKAFFFMRTMSDRLAERFLHVIGVRPMADPLAEVAQTKTNCFMDEVRVADLLSFIEEKPSDPFFAHIHLFTTHGPTFVPRTRHFSVGQRARILWSVDAYDDAIMDFDSRVRDIVDHLQMRNIKHKTVLVICSDHAQRYVIGERIPLVFLFPNGEHSGRIGANVQNLDIAPTILDYLGIEKPAWMIGRSLIAPGLEPLRPIFTVVHKWGTSVSTPGGRSLDKLKIGPPFYSLGSIGILQCQKAYVLNLQDGTLAVFNIKGHTSPCSESDILPPQEAGRLIIDHLAENGYDTSSIRTPLPVRNEWISPQPSAESQD